MTGRFLAERDRCAADGLEVACYVEAMRCPFCRAGDDKVVDSRTAEDGAAIRRRRECLVCHRRFTTYERIEDVPLLVHKRSGGAEPFDRLKLRAGVERAASDRLEPTAIDELVAGVEDAARSEGPDVASGVIGMAVLDRLRGLDPVAYLRFASVYKGFEDAEDFERELGELRAQRRGEGLVKKAPKGPERTPNA